MPVNYLEKKLLQDFQKLYAEFVKAWELIIRFSQKHEDIFKFQFECNQNANVQITKEIVKAKDFKVAHLIFNSKHRDSMSSLIVLETLILAFNNFLFQFQRGGQVDQNSECVSRLCIKDLTLLDRELFDSLIFEKGMTDPTREKQTQVHFDFIYIQETLRSQILKRHCQIKFVEEEFKEFQVLRERLHLSQLMQYFKENFSIANFSKREKRRFDRQVLTIEEEIEDNMNLDQKISCFDLTLSLMAKVEISNESEPELSLHDFITRKKLLPIQNKLRKLDQAFLNSFQLIAIPKLVETLKRELVESFFLAQLPEFLRAEFESVTQTNIRENLLSMHKNCKKLFFQTLTKVVTRLSPRIDLKMTGWAMWDYLDYSPVSDDFENTDPGFSKAVSELLSEHRIQVKHLKALFKLLFPLVKDSQL